MSSINEEKKKIIWQIVTQVIQFHSKIHPEAGTIKLEDKITDYYPTNKKELFAPYNEHANRFGETILDTLINVNQVFDINLKYELGFRQEWDVFETVGDFFSYVCKQTNEGEKRTK